jgi:hypothetical protein
MFVFALVFPAIVGELAWIHIYQALMFVKYGVVGVLAFSSNTRDFKWVVVAIAASSLAVAAVSIVQAFHIR